MKKKRESQEIAEDDEELSPEWRRELKRHLADAHDAVRYAVFSDIGGNGRWRLWLDVSSDCYGTTVEQATLFKREHVARAVALACSEGRRSDLLVAKLTTKGGRSKVLKYEKPKPRTATPKRRSKKST